ncbi:MAG TPA: beta-ketoacyl synthase N-terminal-like domain-containing protein [Pirellulales bacterium]|nr:beta-ketoacyl synthase N-terminal-like domain-containing protein [Pirellulales bacterium]
MSNRLAALSPEQRELLDLLNGRAQPQPAAEPIAVTGIGCRFPGGADCPEAFWRLLAEGRDAVREVPPDRWDADAYYDLNPDAPGKICTRSGGFLDRVDGFDAAFFGISPREATYMDPQQRLLLEVCWEALERAGIAPDSLGGSRTGVFAGLCTNDYFRFVYEDSGRVGAYCATGTFPSAGAGRISYVLGLQGPCMAIDTACSSSLVAVHLACQSLRQKECTLAIASGVSLVLGPDISVNFTKAHMLAPDGRCKTFDAAADGYSRGEGCGVVVLKPLEQAQRDGDTIWGVILGSAVNQDGRSNGLTAPNGLAQEELLRAALAAARVEPRDVSYIEAHGTGTPLGDPIEVAALAAVLGQGRAPDRPLHIGTVKTNIGHLEIAAGMAGLIKTLLCLRHRELPANLHFRQLNPKIAAAIDGLPIKVCQQLMPWQAADGRHIAGISSFGFGGTNAHVIVTSVGNGLRAVPPDGRPAAGVAELVRVRADVPPAPAPPASPHHLLCLSAKTPGALTALVAAYADELSRTDAYAADISFTANTGRAHFEHRLAIVGATRQELAEKLARLSAARPATASAKHAPHDSPTADPSPTNGEATDPSKLAELYMQGGAIDWQAVYRGQRRRRVSLPTYPFQRERYWLDRTASVGRPAPVVNSAGRPAQVAADTSSLVSPSSAHDALETSPPAHPLLGPRIRSASRDVQFEALLSDTSPTWLADHRVRGSVVLPATAYVELALAAARLQSLAPDHWPLTTNSVSLLRFLPLDGDDTLLQTILRPLADGEWQFGVYSTGRTAGADGAWALHAEGRVASAPPHADGASITLDEARSLCGEQLDIERHYRALAGRGLDYGPAFRGIVEIAAGPRRALAKIAPATQIAGQISDYTAHPALLDACLQTSLAALGDGHGAYVPVGWETFVLSAPLRGEVWAYAALDEAPIDADLSGWMILFDAGGSPILRWSGIRLKRLADSGESSNNADAAPASDNAAAPAIGASNGHGPPVTEAAGASGSDETLEQIVHRLAVRVLELPTGKTLAADDDLYGLGMDSIMATELLFHIEKTIGRSLPMNAVIKSRTTAEFVKTIQSLCVSQ